MDGQPANMLGYVDEKLVKMVYAIERFVDIPLSNEDFDIRTFLRKYLLSASYVPKPHMMISGSKLHVVEGILGYSFGEKPILSESLIHKSVPDAVKEKFAYERLEFLGDAVIEFLAMLYFLSRKQQIDGRNLSKNVSSSTNNAALGSLCIELQYYRHLQHRGLEAHIARGRQVFLTKTPQPCYWSSWKKSPIPKVCFANIIESVFGAVFLDSGFNLEAVRGVFGKIVSPFYNRNFPCV
ncbi:Endoribonuclease Dicer [Mortierella sp. AD011]|nr:Endoribonuclease Dicer [Mortierella sp. AD011]